MQFFVIKRTDTEDVFYNLKEQADSFDLRPGCFLPSYDLAEKYIEDELSILYEVKEITLKVLEPNGSWSWEIEI